MPIVLLAGYILLSTMTAVARERAISSDRARVAEVMRGVLESMRNEDFSEIVRLYNPDPLDDPGGPGTAPGDRFDVRGVTPTAPGVSVGRVLLPVMDMSGPGELPDWQVREDIEDASLGMPRDLSGNGVVDAFDHSEDYRVLPVAVEAEWLGKLGRTRFRIFTIMTEFKL